MADFPSFADPFYGFGADAQAPSQGLAGMYGQLGGFLPGQPAPAQPAPAQPAPTSPSFGTRLADFWQSGAPAALGGALLAAHGNISNGLANFGQVAPQVVANAQRRTALNEWLRAKSSGDPNALKAAQTKLLQVDSDLARSMAVYQMTPHPLVPLAPGSTMVDALTGQSPTGAAGYQRGDGSPYDLEQASKTYKAQYGEGANLAIGAPDMQAWYHDPRGWQAYGKGQSADVSQLPPRGLSDTDVRRYNMAANSATKNWIDLPGYKLVSQGAPYLSRIEAASQHPGSISDQELLDSVTKLNNAGGQVTEAQVGIVLKGSSLQDKINVWNNYMNKNGGVLSDDQRKQLIDVAHAVYNGYQKMYQPIYNDAISKLKAQGIPEPYWNIPDLNKLSSAAGIAGGGGEAPAIGAIEEGHRFKGGNPADPNSWEPAQ